VDGLRQGGKQGVGTRVLTHARDDGVGTPVVRLGANSSGNYIVHKVPCPEELHNARQRHFWDSCSADGAPDAWGCDTRQSRETADALNGGVSKATTARRCVWIIGDISAVWDLPGRVVAGNSSGTRQYICIQQLKWAPATAEAASRRPMLGVGLERHIPCWPDSCGGQDQTVVRRLRDHDFGRCSLWNRPTLRHLCLLRRFLIGSAGAHYNTRDIRNPCVTHSGEGFFCS
jgi:hypothetical protein